MSQGNKRGKDRQEVANLATPSTPIYDWVFPLLTLTPGVQASCLASLV